MSLQFSSSTTKPVPLSVLIETAAADDVKTTRLTVFAFTHALRTFSTPWIAGLIMSFYNNMFREGQSSFVIIKMDSKVISSNIIFYFCFSTSGSSEAKFTGVATWKTRSQPVIGASKLPSFVKSAPKIFSSPKGCNCKRCNIFF